MSKSDPSNFSRISLTDTADEISSKIKRAKTDSIMGITYDPENRPEVANLLHIFSALSGRLIPEIAEEYRSSHMGRFKEGLTQVALQKLLPIGNLIKLYLNDEDYLIKVLESGAERARYLSEKKFEIYP